MPVDFQAAQQRVVARRQQREAAARAAFERDNQTTIQRLRRLPGPLAAAGQRGAEAWRLISGREGTEPAFRVGQVDSELLDEELLSLLKDQFGEGLKYFGSNLAQDWSSEIVLVLRAILFKLSIWDNDASYGATLQGLKYIDARRGTDALKPPSRLQKSAYGLSTVVGRYAWDKWEAWLIGQESRVESAWNIRRLLRITSTLSTFHDMAALASFLVFLVNGRYRTLTDRLLRLRLMPPNNQVSRDVSFEYLNRQLVWHAFTEFLLFLLPLVGIGRWRRWLARAWKKTRSLVARSGSGDDESEAQGELGFLPERTCAICYQQQHPAASAEDRVMAMASMAGGITGSAQTDITNPYAAEPCGCLYCFVCLATRLEAEEGHGFACLRCTEIVTECQPWDGDVVAASSRPSSGKSVTFADDAASHGHGHGHGYGGAALLPPIDEEQRDSGYGTSEEALRADKYE